MSGQQQNQKPGARADGRSHRTGDRSAQGGSEGAAPEGARTPERERQWSSRLLHQMGDATSLATVGLTVAALTLLWLAAGFLLAFPAWWNSVLYTVSSSITLVMVFVIQHTQARQQAATQRKLDELLRAVPAANNRLIAVEAAASDGELKKLANSNLHHREQAETETQP